MQDIKSDYYHSLLPASADWAGFLAARETIPPETQRRFTGMDGERAFTDAIGTIDAFLAAAREIGRPLRKGDSLLDFGCGWGRITKSSAMYFEPENITGMDIMPEALEFSRATVMPVRLEQCYPGQPIAFPEASFDFIFAYSVFSHLNEVTARHWMNEFHRVLKPGGIVAVTTRTRGFIKWCETLRNMENPPPHAAGSLSCFTDTADALARYDAGEFMFDGERHEGPLKDTGYGEACIPEGYVKRVWGALFSKAVFVPGHIAQTSQSLIICQK